VPGDEVAHALRGLRALRRVPPHGFGHALIDGHGLLGRGDSGHAGDGAGRRVGGDGGTDDVRALASATPKSASAPTVEGTTIELGRILFRSYLLPFEIVSVLLLVAMVGVILLSKKELK